MSAISDLKDYRCNKGKQYDYDFLLFCIFLTELKNCRRQRQRSCWLKENIDWIIELWKKLGHESVPEQAPSQATISRLLSNMELYALVQKFYRIAIDNSKPDKNDEAQLTSEKNTEALKQPLKHYAIDGKSREGIVSSETGRTEIDVTIFDVQNNQVVAQKTLQDKVGESTAARHLLKNMGKSLPEGIITLDAGFASPKLTNTIINSGHHYIIGLKGNAGCAHDFCEQLAWDTLPILAATEEEGHGRKEKRVLKRFVLTKGTEEAFRKYSRCLYLYCVQSTVTIDGETKEEKRYFFGSRGLKGIPAAEILFIIRSHWRQENCLHWVKDAVLGEDDLFKMSNRSSQVLSFFKNLVVAIGKNFCGSVQYFVDKFDSNPSKYAMLLFSS